MINIIKDNTNRKRFLLLLILYIFSLFFFHLRVTYYLYYFIYLIGEPLLNMQQVFVNLSMISKV